MHDNRRFCFFQPLLFKEFHPPHNLLRKFSQVGKTGVVLPLEKPECGKYEKDGYYLHDHLPIILPTEYVRSGNGATDAGNYYESRGDSGALLTVGTSSFEVMRRDSARISRKITVNASPSSGPGL